MTEDHETGGTQILDVVSFSAAISGAMTAFIVGYAYLVGYPGFSGSWLLEIVLPTYLTVTAIVTVAIGYKEIRREVGRVTRD